MACAGEAHTSSSAIIGAQNNKASEDRNIASDCNEIRAGTDPFCAFCRIESDDTRSFPSSRDPSNGVVDHGFDLGCAGFSSQRRIRHSCQIQAQATASRPRASISRVRPVT